MQGFIDKKVFANDFWNQDDQSFENHSIQVVSQNTTATGLLILSSSTRFPKTPTCHAGNDFLATQATSHLPHRHNSLATQAPHFFWNQLTPWINLPNPNTNYVTTPWLVQYRGHGYSNRFYTLQRLYTLPTSTVPQHDHLSVAADPNKAITHHS